jgi:hypothetical protein
MRAGAQPDIIVVVTAHCAWLLVVVGLVGLPVS